MVSRFLLKIETHTFTFDSNGYNKTCDIKIIPYDSTTYVITTKDTSGDSISITEYNVNLDMNETTHVGVLDECNRVEYYFRLIPFSEAGKVLYGSKV